LTDIFIASCYFYVQDITLPGTTVSQMNASWSLTSIADCVSFNTFTYLVPWTKSRLGDRSSAVASLFCRMCYQLRCIW